MTIKAILEDLSEDVEKTGKLCVAEINSPSARHLEGISFISLFS
jgi:hypothetical protein